MLYKYVGDWDGNTRQSQDATPLERPSPLKKKDYCTTPIEANHNPWFVRVDVTPELEALAEVWDAGGRDLIAEVER